MNQIAIEFEPRTLARHTDPVTSHEAAARVREFARGQCAEILSILREHRLLGAEEIAALTRIDAYSVRKRLADLHNAGHAEPTERTRITISGRKERLWRAL